MREIGFGFKVVALSQGELIPMYKKLNYLASVAMPDYNESGFMRGNMVKLTVGDYIKDLPGFIGGFTYAFNDAAPFEIGIDGTGERNDNIPQVPHMIDVQSFTFKPVHNFVAQRNKGVEGIDIGRFISLTDKAYSANENVIAPIAISLNEEAANVGIERGGGSNKVKTQQQQVNEAANAIQDPPSNYTGPPFLTNSTPSTVSFSQTGPQVFSTPD